MRVGDAVLLRSIYRGRVRWTFPHRYAGVHESGRLALYCGPGNAGKAMKRSLEEPGPYLAAWVRGDPPYDRVWESAHVMRFMRPGDAHTVEIFWSLEWDLVGWYVNLQAPLHVDGVFFDTTDWALDVVVEPDGSWWWKDEDDFAEAIELGVFDDASAAEVRAEGARVVAERPWPTGWEDWRPPREWEPLPLPADWDRV